MDVTSVDGSLVSFRTTYVFARDGAIVTSDSTLRFAVSRRSATRLGWQAWRWMRYGRLLIVQGMSSSVWHVWHVWHVSLAAEQLFPTVDRRPVRSA